MVKEPYKVATQSQVQVSKSSAGILDYSVNYGSVIASGESITPSSWTVSSSDLTVVSDSTSGVTTTAFISGGKNNYFYVLTNTIVTNQSRTFVRTINMKVESK